MITYDQFDLKELIDVMLDHHYGNRDIWRRQCEIIKDYMPPYPNGDTKPQKVVVQFENADGHHSSLRYSKGPCQGFFWDIYGDDFHSPEIALMAILKAPVPPGVQKKEIWNRHNAINEDLRRERKP